MRPSPTRQVAILLFTGLLLSANLFPGAILHHCQKLGIVTPIGTCCCHEGGAPKSCCAKRTTAPPPCRSEQSVPNAISETADGCCYESVEMPLDLAGVVMPTLPVGSDQRELASSALMAVLLSADDAHVTTGSDRSPPRLFQFSSPVYLTLCSIRC